LDLNDELSKQRYASPLLGEYPILRQAAFLRQRKAFPDSI
jgi:hypothetical protein